MTELIYNLVLKGAAGLALTGVLKYRIGEIGASGAAGQAGDRAGEQLATGDVAMLAGDGAAAAPGQPLANVAAEQLPVTGTLFVPLLLGLAARPVSGVAIRLLTGAPVTTYMYRPGPTTDLYLQFNALDERCIGGGLVRILGGISQVYSVLGTRVGV